MPDVLFPTSSFLVVTALQIKVKSLKKTVEGILYKEDCNATSKIFKLSSVLLNASANKQEQVS